LNFKKLFFTVGFLVFKHYNIVNFMTPDRRFKDVQQRESLITAPLAERELTNRFSQSEKAQLAQVLFEHRLDYPNCRRRDSIPIDLQGDQTFFTPYMDREFTLMVKADLLQEIQNHPRPLHIFGRAQFANEVLAIADFLRLLNRMGQFPSVTLETTYFPLQRGDRYQPRQVNGEEYIEVVPMVGLLQLLGANGVKRIFCVDSHSPAFAYFAMREGIHVVDLTVVPKLLDYGLKNGIIQPDKAHITVAGDDGASEMADFGKDYLAAAGIDCPRKIQGEKSKVDGQKEVKFRPEDIPYFDGVTAVIIEDIISTGGTMDVTINMLLNMGVKKIIIIATYPIYVGKALELLDRPEVTVITTDGREPMRDISAAKNTHVVPILQDLPTLVTLDQMGLDYWSPEGQVVLSKMGMALSPWQTYNFDHRTLHAAGQIPGRFEHYV